ncbi:unnamed protein product [Bemisia tabaci]|uniref:Prolyl endopeptidase n=1 Tax=Bemisia tabaci TaxID=7038 RepID=A0A9P0F615_BEMTA|nr:PREDICTED: prolyl endopeptidase isoform X2 [Bemisia tabaci]CAH0393811.1 unnamed protein product [Bemisia tabaci]
MKLDYPVPRRDETVKETKFGVEIPNPYCWMEDPDAEETKAFVDAQNAVTEKFLEQCPVRSKIKERLTNLWNYPKFSCPAKHGDKYFFYKNSGLQNQSVLYVQDSLDGQPREFLDPNTLSDDGKVALSVKKFSEDGKTFAYGISKSGSDWSSIQFKDVETGKDYPEVLEKVKFTSIAWTHDNKGVFYGRYPDQEGRVDGTETSADSQQKLYYHRLNTPQSEDIMVVVFPEEPKYLIGAEVSDCGRWLIITPKKGCQDNLMYYYDLHTLPDGKISGQLKLSPIIEKLECDYDYITNIGEDLIIRTNKNAPNYQLIKINLKKPAPENWQIVVAENDHDVLDWATCAADNKLVLCYVQDVKSVLKVHDLQTGKFLQQLPLDMGTITGFSGEKKYAEVFYQFTSFLTPGIIYVCDLSQPEFKPKVFRQIEVKNFDPSQYVIEQKFYPSKDGTKVPMFLVHQKGLKKDGKNPTLLYGYGGFNINLQPSFSVSRLIFIQNLNGVYAIANIRGGGEYGEKWQNGGRLLNKQNTFDDFIAAGEYLIRENYTSTPYLSIQGGSNGGLLVAACINQRPDLFGAAIIQCGVLDMLHFHKFTIGYAWTSDYGDPDEEKFFHYIRQYSPLHNVKLPGENVQYPATLLLTADHDDRVVPLHSLKFVATLQETVRNHPAQKNPVLIKIETKAGHGAGKPTAQVIEEVTDIFCFIIESLKLKVQD